MVRNEVDYLEGIDRMSVRRMYFVELHSSRCGYRVGLPGILNTPALNVTD